MIATDIAALRQRFADEWETTIPAFYDLQPNQARPSNAPYVHFSVRVGASVHYMGSGAFGDKKQLGRVWLQVFVPSQSGDAVAFDLIDDFADVFRNWSDGVIQCETEEVQGPFDDDNGMTMFTVSVPWTSIRAY